MSKTFYNSKNLRLKNGFTRNPDRYYLEEYFEQLPKHQLYKLTAITSQGTVQGESTEEKDLKKSNLPVEAFSTGDIIHLYAKAKVLEKNANDTLTIRLKFGQSYQENDENKTDTIDLAETSALNVSEGDTVIIDFYIIMRQFNTTNNNDNLDIINFITYGFISVGTSNPTVLNFSKSDNSSFRVDRLLFIQITNQWSASNTDNRIALETHIIEINGIRYKDENSNFVLLSKAGTVDEGGINDDGSEYTQASYNYVENEFTGSFQPVGSEGSGLILTCLEFGSTFLIPKRLESSPGEITTFNNISWSLNFGVEFEMAFQLYGEHEDGKFMFGLIDKISLNKLKGERDPVGKLRDLDIDDQVSVIVNDDEDNRLKIIITINGVNYISIIKSVYEQWLSTKFKLRISINTDLRASVFLNNIQYNMSSISGGEGNLVKPGLKPSKPLSDTLRFLPYVRITNKTDYPITRMKIYYIKMSRKLVE